MSDNTYNGWTNYATWRVQLELVDDEVRSKLEDDPEYFKSKDKFEIADELKNYVEELISSYTLENENGIGNFVESYALAFVDGVNWTELAEAAIEQAKEYQHA